MKTLQSMIQKPGILYIHGLNSNRNSSTYKMIKEEFKGKYNIYTDTFDLLDINKTKSQIEKILSQKSINIVIGSSLGAFYVLGIKNSLAKIIINPCMHPEIEVPKLENNVDIEGFKAMSQDIRTSIDNEMRISTFAIFGDHDELFSYKNEYKKKYDKNNFIMVKGGHRLDRTSVLPAIHIALDYFTRLNVRLNESIVTESFINIVTKEADSEKIEQYKNIVYDMLMKAYEPIGGILGCNDADMLVDDSDFWKLCRKNSKIVAAFIYTFKRGGRKCMYACTDGTPEGKAEFYKVIQDDIRLADRTAWAEVSGAMEHIYIKRGAVPIPAEVAQKILKDKPFVKIHDDGLHYDRIIGGGVHTKIMIGNLK